MKPIPLLCIIISSLLLLIIAVLIISRILHKGRAKSLIESKQADKKLIYQLLRTAHPASKIITNLVLPALPQEGQPRKGPDYHVIDCVLVCRAGVIACFVQKPCVGQIDNPEEEKWVIVGPKGKMELNNPFDGIRPVVAALSNVMKRYYIANNPIIDLVVYPVPSEKLRFTQHTHNLVTSDTLLSHIKDANRERFMSAKEIRDTVRALNACKQAGMRYLRFKKATEAAEQNRTAQ